MEVSQTQSCNTFDDKLMGLQLLEQLCMRLKGSRLNAGYLSSNQLNEHISQSFTLVDPISLLSSLFP